MSEPIVIVKTKSPKSIPGTLVSRPSGNCPYYLKRMSPDQVENNQLEIDVVDDTAAFFSQYDLSEGEEQGTE